MKLARLIDGLTPWGTAARQMAEVTGKVRDDLLDLDMGAVHMLSSQYNLKRNIEKYEALRSTPDYKRRGKASVDIWILYFQACLATIELALAMDTEDLPLEVPKIGESEYARYIQDVQALLSSAAARA